MNNSLYLSRNYMKTSMIVITIITIFIWLDVLFEFNKGMPIWGKIYLCSVFTGLSFTTMLSFKTNNTSQILLLENIFTFPLLPLIALGYISTTKKVAAFVMPLTVLVILVPLITFLTNFLNNFNLGSGFQKFGIPYINLTMILIAFSYSETFFFKFLLSLNPKKIMREKSITSILWVSEQYTFIKISFWFIAILTILTTLEKLSNSVFLYSIGAYKDIIIESLVTLVAIDRAISKSFFINTNKSNEDINKDSTEIKTV